MSAGNGPKPLDAVRALRARGIDSPELLLQFGSPAQLLAACRRWDAREGVRPGLLVKWIRERDFGEESPDDNGPSSQRRFHVATERYPEGSIVETHLQLQRRRYPWDAENRPCHGNLVVCLHSFPWIGADCTGCDYSACWLPGDLVDADGRTPEDLEAMRDG